jgi:hypothetical protein
MVIIGKLSWKTHVFLYEASLAVRPMCFCTDILEEVPLRALCFKIMMFYLRYFMESSKFQRWGSYKMPL